MKTMKKSRIAVIVITLALALVVPTLAFATGNQGGWNTEQAVGAKAQSGVSFVDANADGVCDNYGTGHGAGYVDDDNNGICDNVGTGQGASYLDADADGIGDNRVAGKGCCVNGGGQGEGKGCRNK